MKVAQPTEVVTVSVGDIIKFEHSGSGGQHGFYLVCKDAQNGFFIMNLSGKKSKITYYDSMSDLLDYHRKNDLEVFSSDKFQIKLERL